MENAISISEILGTIHDGSVEVCATAEADYDPTKQKVSVNLDAFTRRVTTYADGQHASEPWLPPGQRVTESLAREDAATFAREVFRSWIRKVRTSVPDELCLRS